MAVKYKVRARIGESKGKPIWRDIGLIEILEGQGRCRLKLDLIPAGPWDGWCMGFEVDVAEDKVHEWD